MKEIELIHLLDLNTISKFQKKKTVKKITKNLVFIRFCVSFYVNDSDKISRIKSLLSRHLRLFGMLLGKRQHFSDTIHLELSN